MLIWGFGSQTGFKPGILGIVCEKGKTFGIYAIRVSRQYSSGYLEEWHIYRRYSDFYDLYIKVREKVLSLKCRTFEYQFSCEVCAQLQFIKNSLSI